MKNNRSVDTGWIDLKMKGSLQASLRVMIVQTVIIVGVGTEKSWEAAFELGKCGVRNWLHCLNAARQNNNEP